MKRGGSCCVTAALAWLVYTASFAICIRGPGAACGCACVPDTASAGRSKRVPQAPPLLSLTHTREYACLLYRSLWSRVGPRTPESKLSACAATRPVRPPHDGSSQAMWHPASALVTERKGQRQTQRKTRIPIHVCVRRARQHQRHKSATLPQSPRLALRHHFSSRRQCHPNQRARGGKAPATATPRDRLRVTYREVVCASRRRRSRRRRRRRGEDGHRQAEARGAAGPKWQA